MTGALAAGVAVAAIGLVPGCAAVEPRPLGAADVRATFAREGIRLAPRPLGDESERWAVRLVSVGVRPPVDVQLYADPSVARTFAEFFHGFQRPPGGVFALPGQRRAPRPRFRVIRRSNAVVVVPSSVPAGLAARVDRALARLPNG